MQQKDNISMNILKEFWICEKCVTFAQHALIEDTSSSYAATFRGSGSRRCAIIYAAEPLKLYKVYRHINFQTSDKCSSTYLQS